MKRHSVMRIFTTKLLVDSDIAIFTGEDMCKEAYQYDRPGNFYLNNNFGLALPFAIGVASTTDKNVFLFTGEGDFIRELAAGIQAAVSKCRNLHIIILNNRVYQAVNNLPNIFGAMYSSRAMLSSFGVFVHDYTSYFKVNDYKSILDFFYDVKGPIAIFVDVDPGTKKKMNNIDIENEILSTRFMHFIKMFEVEEGHSKADKNIPILELNQPITFGGND